MQVIELRPPGALTRNRVEVKGLSPKDLIIMEFCDLLGAMCGALKDSPDAAAKRQQARDLINRAFQLDVDK